MRTRCFPSTIASATFRTWLSRRVRWNCVRLFWFVHCFVSALFVCDHACVCELAQWKLFISPFFPPLRSVSLLWACKRIVSSRCMELTVGELIGGVSVWLRIDFELIFIQNNHQINRFTGFFSIRSRIDMEMLLGRRVYACACAWICITSKNRAVRNTCSYFITTNRHLRRSFQLAIFKTPLPCISPLDSGKMRYFHIFVVRLVVVCVVFVAFSTRARSLFCIHFAEKSSLTQLAESERLAHETTTKTPSRRYANTHTHNKCLFSHELIRLTFTSWLCWCA